VSSAPPITPIDLLVFAEIIDNARTDNNTGVVATIDRICRAATFAEAEYEPQGRCGYL